MSQPVKPELPIVSDGSTATKNEIVVYQPNDTMRLEVRVADESVWLNQAQLCELFGVGKSNISYHLKNIFETGELERSRTVQKIRTVQNEGGRSVVRSTDYFNLEVAQGLRAPFIRSIQIPQSLFLHLPIMRSSILTCRLSLRAIRSRMTVS